jgi:carbon monoxide dehydrogenase subunit G
MQLDHEFTVPVPVAQAWPLLLDIERIAPCMPGATVTKVEGRDFEGIVKVKVGPITVSYGGTATFLETDEAARRAVIDTTRARVTTQLHDRGDHTWVTVSTDLSVTGKPAQFGRGVMADVGAKLLGQFADCLSGKLAGIEQAAAPAAAPGAAAAPAAGPAAAPTPPADGQTAPAAVLDAGRAAAGSGERETPEAIDLFSTAGVPVLKRLAPVLGALALLLILVAVLRRRR